MNNGKLKRILVPIVILVAIIGVWAYKNWSDNADSVTDPNANPDFAFKASEMALETLKAYELPIIINFSTETCPACIALEPILERMNAEFQEKAFIRYINVGKYPSAAEDVPLRVVPTQIFITSEGKPYVPSEGIDVDFTQYEVKKTGELAYTVHEGGLTEEEIRAILADMGVDE